MQQPMLSTEPLPMRQRNGVILTPSNHQIPWDSPGQSPGRASALLHVTRTSQMCWGLLGASLQLQCGVVPCCCDLLNICQGRGEHLADGFGNVSGYITVRTDLHSINIFDYLLYLLLNRHYPCQHYMYPINPAKGCF